MELRDSTTVSSVFETICDLRCIRGEEDSPFFLRIIKYEQVCSMIASLSVEGRIYRQLQTLRCSGRQFIEIARNLGVPIATGPFSEALSGKKSFDQATGKKLLEILTKMEELQASVPVPINWSEADSIALTIASMRVYDLAEEAYV